MQLTLAKLRFSFDMLLICFPFRKECAPAHTHWQAVPCFTLWQPVKRFWVYYLNQMKSDFSPKYIAAQFFSSFPANEPDKHCLMSKLSYTNKSTHKTRNNKLNSWGCTGNAIEKMKLPLKKALNSNNTCYMYSTQTKDNSSLGRRAVLTPAWIYFFFSSLQFQKTCIVRTSLRWWWWEDFQVLLPSNYVTLGKKIHLVHSVSIYLL